MATAPAVVSYPDYTDGNVYQKLLYSSYQGSVQFGSIDAAFQQLDQRQPCILHLHWINQIISGDLHEATRNIEHFKNRLCSFMSRGGKIAWTIHNLYGHATPKELLDTEKQFRHWLVRTVDVLILHKPAHLSLIANEYEVMPKRVYFHSHGLYDIKQPPVTPPISLRGMEYDCQSSFGLIGQIRRYKGIDDACQIVARLSPSVSHHSCFVVAGYVEPGFQEELKDIIDPLRERTRVILIDRRLDDQELNFLTAISRIILLPYRNILNSGSLRFNQSVGIPSLMPSRHQCLFAGEPGVLFYDDYSQAAQLLSEVLSRPRDLDVKDRQSLVCRAKELFRWPDLTNVFAALG